MTPEREPEPSGWLLARRYRDEGASLRAFETTRDLLFLEDLEASTFRFLYEGAWHVGVLGDERLGVTSRERVEAALDAGGETVEVPPFVTDELRRRRRGFKRTGYRFFERRGGGIP